MRDGEASVVMMREVGANKTVMAITTESAPDYSHYISVSSRLALPGKVQGEDDRLVRSVARYQNLQSRP